MCWVNQSKSTLMYLVKLKINKDKNIKISEN